MARSRRKKSGRDRPQGAKEALGTPTSRRREAWSIGMEGYRRPLRRCLQSGSVSTLARLAGGRLQWLQGARRACRRPSTGHAIRRSGSWRCRSRRKGRYAPPVHMIKLTETGEVTPYKWVHGA